MASSIINNFIVEKGSEKYFYTLSEIKKMAESNFANIKHNRTLFQKMKHGLKMTNATAHDIYDDTIKNFDEDITKLSELDFTAKAGLYVDYIMKLHICDHIAELKIKDLNRLLREKTEAYKNECRTFIEKSFSHPLQVSNWKPIINALQVIKGDSDTTKELNIIDNFNILANVLRKTPDYFRPLKLEYKLDGLSEFKDLFKKIINLDIDDIYKPYFNEIFSIIDLTFNDLTKSFQLNIEKNQEKSNPSAEKMLELYKQYDKIEKDFSAFSEKYSQRKYKSKIYHLSEQLNSITEKMKEEQVAYKRIFELQNPIDKIIKCNEKSKDIEVYLDKISHSYIEFSNVISKLKQFKTNYFHEIKKNLKIITDPLSKKISVLPSALDVKFLSEGENALKEIIKIEKKLEGVVESVNLLQSLKTKIETTIEEYLDKLLKNFVPEKSLLQTHIKLLDQVVIQFDKLKNYNKRRENEDLLLQIENQGRVFDSRMNDCKNMIIELEEVIESKDFEKVEKILTTVQPNFDYFNNNIILRYMDTKSLYTELKEKFHFLNNKFQSYKEAMANLESFTLVNPVNQFSYTFFVEDKIQIGRLNNNMKYVNKGKVNIPWKRISGIHALFDFSEKKISDLGSSNGVFSNISYQSLKKNESFDLDQIKEFNLARDITFDFKNEKHFSFFKFRNLENSISRNLSHHQSIHHFCDEWVKKYFIKLETNSVIFISKLDGECYNSIDNKMNYVEIENKAGKYYFSDEKENIVKELIISGENKKITFHFEPVK